MTDIVTFRLSAQSANVIAEALQRMPWHVADPVIKDMQAQLDAYLATKAQTPRQTEIKRIEAAE